MNLIILINRIILVKKQTKKDNTITLTKNNETIFILHKKTTSDVNLLLIVGLVAQIYSK